MIRDMTRRFPINYPLLVIMRCHCDSKNYKTRLKELNLLRTSYRRDILDITMMIKA